MGNLFEPAGEFPAFQIIDQRLHFALVVHHELDVVSGGEAQVAVAVLVGDVADLADMLDAHQTARRPRERSRLLTGLGDVNQHAGFQDLMVHPFSEIFLDDGRQKLLVISGTNISNSILQRICWDRKACL